MNVFLLQDSSRQVPIGLTELSQQCPFFLFLWSNEPVRIGWEPFTGITKINNRCWIISSHFIGKNTSQWLNRKQTRAAYFRAMVVTRTRLWVLECWYCVTNWMAPLPPWGIGELCCRVRDHRPHYCYRCDAGTFTEPTVFPLKWLTQQWQ